MKNYSLKYKFLGLIIFLFLCSFIAFFYIVYDFQKQKLKILKDEQILEIDNSFNKNIEKHLKSYYLEIAKKYTVGRRRSEEKRVAKLMAKAWAQRATKLGAHKT